MAATIGSGKMVMIAAALASMGPTVAMPSGGGSRPKPGTSHRLPDERQQGRAFRRDPVTGLKLRVSE